MKMREAIRKLIEKQNNCNHKFKRVIDAFHPSGNIKEYNYKACEKCGLRKYDK